MKFERKKEKLANIVIISKKKSKRPKKKSSISDNFCKEKKSDLKKVYLWLTPLEYLIEGIFGDLILVLIILMNNKWYIASTSSIDLKYC